MNRRVPESFTCRAAPLPVADVDTDQIVPARFLKGTSRAGFEEALFADWRAAPDAGFVLDHPPHAGAEILLTGENFGCGSSREHAVWALLDGGLRAVVGPSFADIFKGNAWGNGLVAAAIDTEAWRELLAAVEGEPTTPVTVELARQRVSWPGGSARFEVDPFAKHCLLEGVDRLGYLLSLESAITQHEGAAPPLVPTNRPFESKERHRSDAR